MTFKTTTALAAMMAAGIAGTASAGEPTSAPALSATGPASFLGDPEAKTLEMLVEEVNANGGINGEEIELIALRRRRRPEQGAHLRDAPGRGRRGRGDHRRLDHRHNHVDRRHREDEEVPFISLAGAIVIIDPVKAYVFKTPHTDRMACEKIFDDMQARGITEDRHDLGHRRLRRVDGGAVPGRGGDYGIEIVADETYGPQDADMTPQLTNIRNTRRRAGDPEPRLRPGPGDRHARTAAQLGIDVPLYQIHGVASDAFIELAGPTRPKACGCRAPRCWWPTSCPRATRRRRSRPPTRPPTKTAYGSEPSTFGGYAHDAFRLMVDAIERAGSTEPQAIRDALEATDGLVGTTGTYTFSPEDHLGLDLSAFRMLEIRDGDWSSSTDAGSAHVTGQGGLGRPACGPNAEAPGGEPWTRCCSSSFRE